MAAEDAVAGAATHGFDFMKTKLGPLPIAAWGAIAIGIWLYLQRKNKTAGTGQQIDSAGNVGAIDPTTGYVAGSLQDRTALASSGSGGSGTSTSSSGSGSTTAGQYATNADWGRAAVNFLVGLGIDPTTANQAIQLYLSSQTLSIDQQGSVNLAIQALGAPPQLPGAAIQNPTPVVTPPAGGAVKAANPPTGVAMAGNVGRTTLAVKWNAVANATGYTVSYGYASDATGNITTSPADHTGITIGNLTPGRTYFFKVQATPASAGAGWGGPVSGATSK